VSAFPKLGAVSHGIAHGQIQVTPHGQNALFSQAMRRMPGVIQDIYGEMHVCGEHTGLTCRMNGISQELPHRQQHTSAPAIQKQEREYA